MSAPRLAYYANPLTLLGTKCIRIAPFALLVPLAAVDVGCSFIFVTPPKSEPSATSQGASADTEPVDETRTNCTTSKLAPVVDAIVAGYQAYRTGAAISATDAQYASAPFSRNTDIALGITLFGTFLVSSIYGVDSTSRCNDVQQAEDRRIRQRRRGQKETEINRASPAEQGSASARHNTESSTTNQNESPTLPDSNDTPWGPEVAPAPSETTPW